MKLSEIHKKVRLLPIYAVFLSIWFFAGVPKILSGGPGESFVNDFGSTFLASFPGLSIAFYQIAIFELIAAFLFVISFLKLEFMPDRPKLFLELGLFMSMVNFSMLGFGLGLIGNHTGVASLFFYFGATAAISVFVFSVPRDGQASPPRAP